MKTQNNEETKQPDSMELLKQQAESGRCNSGCTCHSGTSPSKARWIISAVVLVAASILVVKAINKKPDSTAGQPPSNTFAVPTATATAAPVVTAPVPAETVPAESTNQVAEPNPTSVGTIIGQFSELNTIAVGSDAVFVYLPGKESNSNAAPSSPMQAAVKTIESRGGGKCALFTLKSGSPDYDKVSDQMTTPGVLAMVKGKGMSAISGEVTESKLVQSFVTASSAGGCGSGSSGGCGPASSGCN